MSPPGREGLVAALVPDEADRVAEIALAQMADIFGDRAHLALTHRRRPGEAKRLHALDALARRHGVRGLATGDVLYDGPDKRMLQDVVTAIREHCTIDELGFRRERFADRHLEGAGRDGAPLQAPSRTRSAPPPTSPSAAPSRCASCATNIPTRS